ncbi:MAG: GntR family transcriptional regulator, partial [bacterium]|nr:GntR family transcriptional regulator [bacterium]
MVQNRIQKASGASGTTVSDGLSNNPIQIPIDRGAASPVYQQLADALLQLIQTDVIAVGDGLPPENTLCELSGVSRMTVRKAIDALRKEGIVVSEQGRGTFVIAKRPSRPKILTVGFVLRPDRFIEEDPYYSQILLGVTQEAEKQGLSLRFIQGETFLQPKQYAEHYAYLSSLSGLLVAGQMPDPFLAHLQRIRIPLVFVNYKNSQYRHDAVTCDPYEVGCRLGTHFYELGHREILYLTGEPGNIAYEERLAGFRACFEKDNPASLVVLPGGKDPVSGRRLIQEAFERGVVFTAVAAANDEIAVGAMNELQDRGVRIPQDVSVAGIDNLSLCENCRPALTSVHIEKRGMGSRAVEVLLHRIQNPGA